MQTPDSQQLAAEEAWADEIEASRAEATGAADDDDMTMDELRAEALQRKRKPPEQQATSPGG